MHLSTHPFLIKFLLQIKELCRSDYKQQVFMMSYYSTWTCQNCQSEIREDVYPCPNCPQQEEKPFIPEKRSKNQCPSCTFENPEFVTHCQLCEFTLIEVPDKVERRPTESVMCKACNQQNHASNQVCVFCEEDLYEQPKKRCAVCQVNVKESLYDQHYTSCLLNSEIIEREQEQERQRIEEQLQRERRQALKDLQECIHCREKIMPHESAAHLVQCRKNAMKDLMFDEKTRMTPLQMEAMRHMHMKSEKQHNAAKSALQQRVKKLGYSIEDLNNLQFYIQNYAPIIIHIHVSKYMEFFVKDTHYRSQFETNKSSGSLSRQSRTTWENRMFDSKYAKATDFERVKYGVINFTNDPKGVKVCAGYGASYLLLKEHVRERCTFTDMDSSSTTSSIGTFKFCFKILSKLNDTELKSAFEASKAKEMGSDCTATYKQIQIHGPIQFSKDVECIYVNRNEIKNNKKLLDMVYEFSKKNNVNHDFI